MRKKRGYIRSKEILALCRDIPCQHCGAQDGTVVAAHSNQAKHGKGRGIKASDEYVAALCWVCHHQIDQGFLFIREEKEQLWWDAHVKTWHELHRRGVYPSNIDYVP